MFHFATVGFEIMHIKNSFSTKNQSKVTTYQTDYELKP